MVGNIFFLIRLLETIVIGFIILNLITTINLSNDLVYYLTMVVLSIESIKKYNLIYKHETVPKWLAIWGRICNFCLWFYHVNNW